MYDALYRLLPAKHAYNILHWAFWIAQPHTAISLVSTICLLRGRQHAPTKATKLA